MERSPSDKPTAQLFLAHYHTRRKSRTGQRFFLMKQTALRADVGGKRNNGILESDPVGVFIFVFVYSEN